MHSPWSIRVIAFTAIIVFTVAAWIAQHEISKKEHAKVGYSLETILDTSHQAIRSWLKEQKAAAKLWANSPEIRKATQQLLAVQRKQHLLLASEAQNDLRTWFRPVEQAMGYQGYFIIDSNNISLASSRDQNVGFETPLLSQPETLRRIRLGETIASIPQTSLVPLPDNRGVFHEGKTTLFIGAPILNDVGQVIAIFTFRLNPDEDFTAILQQGRMGETGETYAFNKQARLISSSRFDQDLREAGLIATNKQATLNIDIRDPGVNLVSGQRPTLQRAQQPLTRMAANAVQGNSGVDLEGYRDYRGVPVVGAWLWDSELGFGITVEQEINEAYSTLRTARYTVYSLLFMLILLSLASAGIYGLHQRRQLAEKKFRALLESAPDAMVIVDDKGFITLINKQTEKLFGYTQDELLGQAVEILVPPQYKNSHSEFRREYIREPETRRMGADSGLSGKAKDGSIIPVEISLSYFGSNDDLLVVSAIRDISERKKTEAELILYRDHLEKLVKQRTSALEASNKELESYSHSIAHDLRQPLRAITGFSQILLADAFERLNTEEKNTLDRISSAGIKMSRLIEDILELSRITRCRFHPTEIDLSELSQQIVVMLEKSQPERVVLTHIQEGVSANCDPKLAGIALQQLFNNAWKFTQESSTAKIEFGCREISNEPVFYVQDNGIGFDMKYTDTLFKPFQHPHSATHHGVTGVGLAMAQRAIQRHNGRIWADSKPGHGTTFYFTLP